MHHAATPRHQLFAGSRKQLESKSQSLFDLMLMPLERWGCYEVTLKQLAASCREGNTMAGAIIASSIGCGKLQGSIEMVSMLAIPGPASTPTHPPIHPLPSAHPPASPLTTLPPRSC